MLIKIQYQQFFKVVILLLFSFMNYVWIKKNTNEEIRVTFTWYRKHSHYQNY